MGRNRKKSNNRFPKYVYENRGRIIYRPPGEKNIVLGAFGMSMADIEGAVKKLTQVNTEALQYIADKYFQSERFKALKSWKETQRNINNFISLAGNPSYRSIKPVSIREYLDMRGKVSKVSANREIAALSSLWAWAREYDYINIDNPAKGVRKFTEKSRDRYVTDAEYKAVYDVMPHHIQVSMELAYLCRMRLSEVLDTRCSDIEEHGLNTRRLKGSDDALTTWTPRLQSAVDSGLNSVLRVPKMTIVNVKGSPVKRSSFQTTWQRYMVKFEKENGFRFSFHDLKRKGGTDFDGDKKKGLGHKSESMVRVYNVERIEVESTK